MVFSSILFLFVFLPLVLLIYHASPARARNTVLLLASLLFYAWGAPRFLLVLMASVWIDWVVSVRIAAQPSVAPKRRWLAAALAQNLGLLIFFKYVNFAMGEWNRMAAVLGLDAVAWSAIALPIGISFFTFHKISYLVDVYRGITRPAPGYGSCLLYITLFPQLIAGPIIRYHDVASQIDERRCPPRLFLAGIQRFAVGLGKKVLVANVLAATADATFALAPDRLGTAHAWLGIVAYAFQIYFDFSGYSDMAIGLGRMFGFEFLENFDRPYRARTMSEFWQRWHISLSNFMREYLYIPLGGNRVAPARRYLNLWIVFLVSGIWHGAAWTFIFWGAYQGLFLSIDKMGWSRIASRLPAPAARAITFVLVLFGWVFFRAADLPAAWSFLGRLIGLTHANPEAAYVLWRDLISHQGVFTMALAALIVFLPLPPLAPASTGSVAHAAFPVQPLRLSYALALIILAACSLANSTYNPFIYFRF